MEKEVVNQEWKELTALTGGAPITVERVRLRNSTICIEGSFDLPELAQLSLEDQVFVTQFLRSHGSIKDMERLFAVSYPTIKSRLNKICERLGLGLAVETNPVPSRAEILDRLERGEISADQAVEALARK